MILVPFEKLPGGHQAKNAERLQKSGAVEVVSDAKMEEKPELLLTKIKELLSNDEKREALAVKLHEIAKTDASVRMMEMIMEVRNRKHK